MSRRSGFVITALVLSLLGSAAIAKDQDRGEGVAKNVIFLVPDGMGLADVTAARIFKNGPDGAPLSFETLETIGYQRTHAANSTVTDSAAAAAAWACGEKFNNGEISCHSEGGECYDNPYTVLEIAQTLGKSTGLVASSQISHATPAAFAAHTHSRNCGVEIARQMIEEVGVDVALGGGVYRTGSGYGCEIYGESATWGQQQIIDLAEAEGYVVAGNLDEMNEAVADGEDRILGLFTDFSVGKTPEMFRLNGEGESTYPDYPAGEPTLAEMTAAALDVLEHDRQGFFLVVEGSQIDWAGHANALDYMLGEMLAFDAMTEVVFDWIDAKPNRKAQTLVVVVADHETGGFAIDGPYGTLSEQGEMVVDGWTSGNHSAVDTVIWAQGPGASGFGRALDNTDLFDLLLGAMQAIHTHDGSEEPQTQARPFPNRANDTATANDFGLR
jgi:alkaline phosphatase